MSHDELDRSLGLTDLLAVVMGAIVGVGIFFQPGRVVALAGSPGLALLAWIAGGAIALAGALTFAELGALIPRTGGQYLVLKQAWGRPIAFLYCWALGTVIQSGAIGIIAIICIQYLGRFLGLAPSPLGLRLTAAVLVAGLTAVNVLGVRGATRLANLAMALKVIAILAIAALGLLAAPATSAADILALGSGDRLQRFAPALIPVLFSFGGWQQALYIAGEVKRPGRNLPLGIVLGVSGVIVLYLAINLGYLALLGSTKMAASTTLASDAVAAVFPGGGERLAALAVAISALGIANVCMLSGPRMYKAMADDGGFLAVLGRVHPTLRTPANAVLAQGGVSIALILVAGLGGIDYLTTGVVCLDWVFFALTGAALFRLRRRLPDADRPFRVWGYPIVPGLFVLASIGAVAAAFSNPATVSASIVAVVVLLTGVVVFAFSNRGLPG